ncbi:MAG: DnaJ domain-containing protein [Candidatus Sericytochromatia bacterium]|nr:DnaJ domain-containing protein [Candidatus Sericytochromatia bacterium]
MEMISWLEDDYYHLLGISQSSTVEEIHKAYRLKAKQTHPDIYPLDSTDRILAEKKFRTLLLARDTLLDIDQKDEYDNQRLVAQQCYLSYISTSYSLPLNKETIVKKPSFKDQLKEEMEKQDSKSYTYSEEDNSYIPQQEYTDYESMSKEERANQYKKAGAKKFYALALRCIGYKDYRRAMMYFKSAQHLDPSVIIPRQYFPSY